MWFSIWEITPILIFLGLFLSDTESFSIAPSPMFNISVGELILIAISGVLGPLLPILYVFWWGILALHRAIEKLTPWLEKLSLTNQTFLFRRRF
jgi:hypothetical protein